MAKDKSTVAYHFHIEDFMGGVYGVGQSSDLKQDSMGCSVSDKDDNLAPSTNFMGDSATNAALGNEGVSGNKKNTANAESPANKTVEAVAEAICNKHAITYSELPEMPESKKPFWRDVARAAISAHDSELKKHIKVLVEALAYYADPQTYFATSILTNRPCGDFENDYSAISKEQEELLGIDAYRGCGDVYYGKTAREALASLPPELINN